MEQTTDKIIAEAKAKIEAFGQGPAPTGDKGPEATPLDAETKGKAIAEIMKSPSAVVAAKVSENVVIKINTDEQTGKRVEQVAEKIIGSGLKAEDNKATAAGIRAESEVKDADFESNKAEFLHHGIDHKVKPWQSKVMCVINDIWFVIISIIFAFTLVPFSEFLSRIRAYSRLLRFVAGFVGISMLLTMLFGLTVLVLNVCGIDLLKIIGG
jgi:hypothetical protein